MSIAGFMVSQISEPSLRMVGISTSHDFLQTLCASSTHTMSTPSNDLIESMVWPCSPPNRNRVPFFPRISVSSTS
ncbi:hypothetical protein D3C84_1108000 [compost metagenome]